MPAPTIWAWIGVAFFAAGSLAFVLLGRGVSRRNRHHFVTILIVALVTLGAYLALAVRQDAFVEWMDWALTTPLLLAGIVTLALPHAGKQPVLVGGIIFSDLFMIAAGIFAGLSGHESGAKWAWYAVSCGAFAALYVQIWGPLRSAAIGQRYRGEELLVSNDPDERHQGASYKGETSLFYRQAGLLSVLWLIYPIVFLVSSRGLNLLPPAYSEASYTVLEISSKVGFGLLLLVGIRRIEREAGKALEETNRGGGSRHGGFDRFAG